MKRIFAGSLCITKQKLYVVIFAALIVAALLITSIVLYTRNIVRIDESSMPAEISGLYVGLNGNWHKALYFEPAPYNKDFGLYMQLTDFSVEVEDGSSFIETGAWTFDGEYVNIVSDSMREMQKAMEALGEEAPAYEGTDYTVWGNYIFNLADICEGNIPGKNRFRAICKSDGVEYRFNYNGTYTYTNDKVTECGKYTRNCQILSLMDENSGKVKELFVYNGGATPFAWVKSSNQDLEMERLNTLSEGEEYIYTKGLDMVSEEIRETIREKYPKLLSGNVSVITGKPIKCEKKSVILGYILFDIEYKNEKDPACYPMKCTINYADGTAVYSRYGSLFTIRGMSLDDYKEYMNDK